MEGFLSRAWAQAAEPQHKIAEAVEGDDRRPEQKQEERNGPHDPERRTFAALKRKALRRKLAENDMEGSDDDEGVRDDESKYGEYSDQIEHTSIGTRHDLLSGGRCRHRSFNGR